MSQISPTRSGRYILTVTENGCPGKDTINLNFFKVPQQLSEDTSICRTDTVFLDLSCFGCRYLWENGDTIGFQRIHSPSQKSLQIIDTNNCIYNSFMTVNADDRPECILDVFVPTTFTPDGDGYNETFFLVGEYIDNIRLSIFNRWGQRIFYQNTEGPIWDGTFDGEPCKLDVYVWRAEVQFITGEKRYLMGHVNLLR